MDKFKVGDIYVDCGLRIRYLVNFNEEQDDMDGFDLGDPLYLIGNCSLRHCGPEKMTNPEEIAMAIAYARNYSGSNNPGYYYYTYDSLKYVHMRMHSRNFATIVGDMKYFHMYRDDFVTALADINYAFNFYSKYIKILDKIFFKYDRMVTKKILF